MAKIVKQFTEKKFQTVLVEELLRKELVGSEFGGARIKQTSFGTKITIKAGRVGIAIGRRGRNIRRLTEILGSEFNFNNVQLEVEDLENPDLNPWVIAERLALSIERGRHYRRTAYGLIRRILDAGAKGVEITIRGKVASQRARREAIRAGYVAKCGDPAFKFVKEGMSIVKMRRGVIGIVVKIMAADAELPDDIRIIAEPTSQTRELLSRRDEEDLKKMVELEEQEELSEEATTELDVLEEVSEESAEPEIPAEAVEEDPETSTEAIESLDELEESDNEAESLESLESLDEQESSGDQE